MTNGRARSEELQTCDMPGRLSAYRCRAFLVLEQIREAYAEVVAAFREASERLLGGDQEAEFLEGTFPPGLPFVRYEPRSRGQPA